jgi:hypothetical protein
MTQLAGELVIDTGRSTHRRRLDEYLSPDAAEQAESAAVEWIKAMRQARVGRATFRDRFTHRGDSLWWFAELYFHKRQVIVRALRTIAALEALLADGRPAGWRVDGRDPVVQAAAAAVARREGVAGEAAPLNAGRRSRALLRTKAVFHTGTAWLDRLRPTRPPGASRGAALAFVHSAFWSADRGQESYLGPVLAALERRMAGGVTLVGIGPRTNFRVRRWRDRLAEFGDPSAHNLPFMPIEALAGWRALAPSRKVWSARESHRRALSTSHDIRAHASVRGVDLWPLVSEELGGVAELQFPWSAKAMDEAGAALDMLDPRVAVTYAEAGGWGRAIVLESRRRGIPTAGVQHGFIYRHWLNYVHAADEMAPSPGNAADAGFPRPTRTLLFDGFAAAHLRTNGCFPADAIAVTGSPSLERFVSLAAGLDERERSRIRTEAGVEDGTHLVLVAAKHAQLGPWFARLVSVTADNREVTIVVKPHPAEGPEPYVREAGGAPHVRVASASADLARLTAAARVIVTANSTAAIEAMAIDVPALVVGLPNNLTPFVEAGAMAGVTSPDRLCDVLSRLVRDEAARAALAACRRAFIARYEIVQPPGAADRAADAISALARVH